MRPFFFWKGWSLGYKVPYILGILVLFATIGLYGAAYFLGDHYTYPWLKDGSLEVLKTFMYGYNFNFFEFKSVADSYLLFEKYKIDVFQVNQLAYKIYGAVLFVGWAFILTSISDLKRLWYLLGIGVFSLFIATLHLDELRVLANVHEKAFLVLVLLTFLLLTFYFHSFNRNVNYGVRLLTYLVVEAGFIYWALTGSVINNTEVTMLSHGMAVPMLLVGIFILLTGQTLPLGILYLITSKNDGRGSGSPKNFYGLFGIYLFNLLYAFVHQFFYLDLGLFYLHPFVMMPLSSVLGIWLMGLKEPLYNKIMVFEPTAAFLHLGVSIIALISVAFAFAVDLEPLISVYSGVISIVYIAMGFAFMIYIVINFYDILRQELAVHKVVFQPKQLNFLMGWTVGIVLIVVFAAMTNFGQKRKAFSAYYILQGDMERLNEERFLAQEYYKIADTYSPSHRTAFSRASLAMIEGNSTAAAILLKDATRRRALPQTFVGLSDYYLQEKNTFEAVFVLEEGLKTHPQSKQLHNNIALLYHKTGLTDSALTILREGIEKGEDTEMLRSNLFALISQSDPENEFVKQYLGEGARGEDNYSAAAANRMAFLNTQSIVAAFPFNEMALEDSVLQTPELCYLYNYILNKRGEVAEDILNLSEHLEKIPSNYEFEKFLKFARFYDNFDKGNMQEAYSLLYAVQRRSGELDTYNNYQLGLFFLKLKEYWQAAEYFKKSFYNGKVEAVFPLAIALSELPDKAKAATAWENAARVKGLGAEESVDEFKWMVDKEEVDKRDFTSAEVGDITKYRYLHYYGKELSAKEYGAVLYTIQDNNIRALLAVEMAEYLLEKGEFVQAEKWMPKDASLYSEGMQYHFVLLQAYIDCLKGGKSEDLMATINQIPYRNMDKGWQAYMQAIWNANNQKYEEALKFYDKAAKQLAFLDRVHLDYVALCEKQKQEDKVYDIIYNALLLNPSSLAISEKYIQHCLSIGRDNYAKEALMEISEFLTDEQNKALEVRYKAYEEEAEKKANEWVFDEEIEETN